MEYAAPITRKGRSQEMNLKCDTCRNSGDLSPLRLGRICGHCKKGKYVEDKSGNTKKPTKKKTESKT